MSITVAVSGSDRRLRFDWPRAAAVWAAEAGPLARAAVRSRAPVSKQAAQRGRTPGTLRDSIASRSEGGAGQMLVVLYSTDRVARFVIGGTRPHPIAARNASALHWQDASGDRFARSVRHPGTRPNPFPERALKPLEPVLMERFARAAKEAMT